MSTVQHPPKNLIVIVGPISVGKTALYLKLAKELDTEIIFPDSRQFFRKLSIGTAKPSAVGLSKVPRRLTSLQHRQPGQTTNSKSDYFHGKH